MFPESITTVETNWVSVKRREHTLALRSDGTLWAGDTMDMVRLGTVPGLTVLPQFKIGTDNQWTTVNRWRYHSIGLKVRWDSLGHGDIINMGIWGTEQPLTNLPRFGWEQTTNGWRCRRAVPYVSLKIGWNTLGLGMEWERAIREWNNQSYHNTYPI